MFKSLIRPFFILAISLAVAIVFILINALLEFSQKLGGFHPYLQWGFIAIVAALFIIYILTPFLKVISYPRYVRLPDKAGTEQYYKYLWYLRNNLLRSPSLENESVVRRNLELADRIHQGDLEKSVKGAIAVCNKNAEQIVRDAALNVGIFTAISQSGRLDAIIVMVNNIRMINKIIPVYRQRPSAVEILKLYSLAGGTAFLADQVEDMDINETVVESLQSFGVSGLPVPVLGKLIDVAVQGTFNAFLTLRVGYAVKNACGALDICGYESARRDARREAISKIPQIISQLKENIFGKIKSKVLDPFKKYFGIESEQHKK